MSINVVGGGGISWQIQALADLVAAPLRGAMRKIYVDRGYWAKDIEPSSDNFSTPFKKAS